MAQTVEGLLSERRSQTFRGGRITGALVAILVHGGAVAFALAAPNLFAKEPEPLQYVPVLLVPPQLLGVEKPPPPQPSTEPEPTPEPPKPRAEEPSPDAMEIPTSEEPEPSEPDPPPAASETPAAETRNDPGPDRPQGSTSGSSVGVATTNSVVGVVDPNFTYGYYVDRMVAIIRSQWVRPPLGSGVEGAVRFRIRDNGSVRDVRVVESSGYNSFDLAALRAVQGAPLPPLPKSYKKDFLDVNLIFR